MYIWWDEFVAERTINRQALSKIIFEDKRHREKLNSIVHPKVLWQIFLKIFYAFVTGEGIVILDVPLLFEAGYETLCSRTIVVFTSPEIQLKRLIKRDYSGISSTENINSSLSKIKAQMPLDDKLKKATVGICNDGPPEQSIAKVLGVLQNWKPSPFVSFLQMAILPVLVLTITFVGGQYLFGKQ